MDLICDAADIDECATNNGGCSANATCTNNVGSFTCTCLPGYTGDGFTCSGKSCLIFCTIVGVYLLVHQKHSEMALSCKLLQKRVKWRHWGGGQTAPGVTLQGADTRMKKCGLNLQRTMKNKVEEAKKV